MTVKPVKKEFPERANKWQFHSIQFSITNQPSKNGQVALPSIIAF